MGDDVILFWNVSKSRHRCAFSVFFSTKNNVDDHFQMLQRFGRNGDVNADWIRLQLVVNGRASPIAHHNACARVHACQSGTDDTPEAQIAPTKLSWEQTTTEASPFTRESRDLPRSRSLLQTCWTAPRSARSGSVMFLIAILRPISKQCVVKICGCRLGFPYFWGSPFLTLRIELKSIKHKIFVCAWLKY